MKLFRSAIIALGLLALIPLAHADQPIQNYSSGNKTNAAAVATVPASLQQFGFLTGFEITSAGATAGLCVNPTVTGLMGGTMTYVYCFPTGAAVGVQPLTVEFAPPLKSAAFNTAIVVTLPASGAGGLLATVVAHGYNE